MVCGGSSDTNSMLLGPLLMGRGIFRDALDHSASRIIVGMGGSATNDGGAGMAMALGARLLDAKDRLIPRGAAGLKHLSRVTTMKCIRVFAMPK